MMPEAQAHRKKNSEKEGSVSNSIYQSRKITLHELPVKFGCDRTAEPLPFWAPRVEFRRQEKFRLSLRDFMPNLGR